MAEEEENESAGDVFHVDDSVQPATDGLTSKEVCRSHRAAAPMASCECRLALLCSRLATELQPEFIRIHRLRWPSGCKNIFAPH